MKLMILDGNSIVNRAFYGVRQLNAPDGTPSNAVYGFIAILQRLLDEQRPEAVCVAFDLKAPTFRHKAYDAYKAQRKPMPEELAVQMPILKDCLDAMGIRRYELEGYEADDILGTAAKICAAEGWQCLVVTGDKDSLQLVSENTTVCNVKSRMGHTETTLYTPQVFREEYGFEPEHIIDLKALMGDSSDNIPGVPGVGEKTAMTLVQSFETIDKLYASINDESIKESVRKKLVIGEESARLSYWLATINCSIPLDFKPDTNIWNHDYKPELYGLFKRLGFNKFIEKWGLEEQTHDEPVCHVMLIPRIDVFAEEGVKAAIEAINGADSIAVYAPDGLDSIEFCDGSTVYRAVWAECGDAYNELLRSLFNGRVKIETHNAKDLIRNVVCENLSPDGICFDTALAAYLLDATRSDYELKRLSMGYLGDEIDGAQAISLLGDALKAELAGKGMEKLYYEIELPLCWVLADMERSGFYVDRKALYEYGESLNQGIVALQQSIWEHAGREFNISSPKQLGEILFEELMLPAGKKTKTGWSTGAEVLEKLRDKHPIVDEVLDYRMLTKLKSTYADGLLKVIDADGRIRTKFQMTVTATGRLSSTEPNLQNIPVRKELGAQIRRMFVAAPGMTLVDADYSQIELRLLAHISGDKAMTDAFLSGEDFHTVTASNVFGVPIEQVSSQLRSRAKAVNFGIVYGISAFSLSQDIGVFPNEAKAYMDAYLEKYHGVRDYMKRIVEKGKADGYVDTLYGRRRALPELKSSNFNMRSFGERVALNMPIQGTAADIIKLAMVRVYKRIKHENLKARLILQVHDELIVECPLDEADRVKNILTEEMENAAELSVPLVAEAHCARSWAEAH